LSSQTDLKSICWVRPWYIKRLWCNNIRARTRVLIRIFCFLRCHGCICMNTGYWLLTCRKWPNERCCLTYTTKLRLVGLQSVPIGTTRSVPPNRRSCRWCGVAHCPMCSDCKMCLYNSRSLKIYSIDVEW